MSIKEERRKRQIEIEANVVKERERERQAQGEVKVQEDKLADILTQINHKNRDVTDLMKQIARLQEHVKVKEQDAKNAEAKENMFVTSARDGKEELKQIKIDNDASYQRQCAVLNSREEQIGKEEERITIKLKGLGDETKRVLALKRDTEALRGLYDKDKVILEGKRKEIAQDIADTAEAKKDTMTLLAQNHKLIKSIVEKEKNVKFIADKHKLDVKALDDIKSIQKDTEIELNLREATVYKREENVEMLIQTNKLKGV